MKFIYRIGVAAVFCAGVVTTGSRAQDNTNVSDLINGQSNFSKVGTGTGSFLTLPVGARATAMGGAYAGVADDPTALYWNPAGIMLSPGSSASYSYAALFGQTKHNFAGITFPLGTDYKIGLSAITYGTDDIGITTLFQQQGTGESYTVRDLAFGLTLAGQLTEQFSFGATGKLINLGIADITATGVAFDVSTMYKPGILGMRIGFAVQNLSAPLKYTGPRLEQTGGIDPVTGNKAADVQLDATEASLPLIFRAGISTDVLEGNENHSLLFATEFTTSSDSPEKVGLGAEYVWRKLLAARLGYQFGSPDAFGLSGGVGVNYQVGNFTGQLDYAARVHNTMGLVHQITASVRFQ